MSLGVFFVPPGEGKERHSGSVAGYTRTPRIGDRIQLCLPRLGIYLRGTVHHVDDLQILVKWDDGRSENLRPAFADRFRIVDEADDDPPPGD